MVVCLRVRQSGNRFHYGAQNTCATVHVNDSVPVARLFPRGVHHRHRRQPLQAPGFRLPVRRDLRRHPVGLGLRPPRRRAQGEHQAAVVAVHGHQPRRRRRPGLARSSCRARCGWPPATSACSPTRWSSACTATSGFRADHLQEAFAEKTGSRTPTRCRWPTSSAPNCGTRGQWTEPRDFNMMLKTYLGPVEDEAGLHYLRPETAQGIFVNFANVLHRVAQEAAVRHRPDRQVLPQRDHAGQLHLPHPRVRADGDGVLRRARHRRGVAPVLDRRRALQLVRRPRHRRRTTCASTSTRRRSCRTTPSAPSTSSTGSASSGIRVGRARGHRQPHRLRPVDALASTPASTCRSSTRPPTSARPRT